MKSPWAWLRNILARRDGQDPVQQQRYVLPYPVAGINLTADESLSLAAVWACITVIAQSIGSCRWNIYTPVENRREMLSEDPLIWLLNTRPNPDMTAIGWREAMLFVAIPFGNSYAEIVRDAGGRVVALWPLPYERVTPRRDPATWDLVYEYRQPDGTVVILESSRVFHLRGPGLHGLMGENVIARAAKSLGVAAAQERHSAAYFGQGAAPGGVLKAPGEVNQQTYDRLKEDWAEKKKGPENAHKPLILEAGWSFETVTNDPQKSQLVEARQFSVEEICFVPGTRILTPAGPRAIESIVEGDLVLTHKGRWRPVRKVMSRAFDGQAVTCQAKGLAPVTATANHPFFAQTVKPARSHALTARGEPSWIPAGELRAGTHNAGHANRSRAAFHSLVMPRLTTSEACEAIDLLDWARAGSIVSDESIRASSNHRATSVTRHPAVDARLGWLCGLFVADGSTSDHQVAFYLGAHEPEITAQLRDLLGSVFGLQATTTRTADNVDRTVVSNRVLADFFAQFGNVAHEKRLSDWCISASPEFREGAVAGLVAGDGGTYKRDTYLRTTSIDLAWQVRLLLWADGINSGLEHQPGGTWRIRGRSGPKREIWTVRWRVSRERRGSMGVAPGHVFFSLDRHEVATYRGRVFNLEVEEDESYTTVGGVVHNCRWFGVPPHKIQHLLRSTFANIEHQSIEFARDALTPWCRRLEQEADYKLCPQRRAPWKHTLIDTAPLTAGDALSRAQAYAVGRQNGYLTANEIRALEGMNSIGPDGDVLLVQSNLTTVERLINPPPPPAPPAPALPPGGAASDSEDPESDPADAEGVDSEADAVARQALTVIVCAALERHGRRVANRNADLNRNASQGVTVSIDPRERNRFCAQLEAEISIADPFVRRVFGRGLTSAEIEKGAALVESGVLAAEVASKLLPASCPRPA